MARKYTRRGQDHADKKYKDRGKRGVRGAHEANNFALVIYGSSGKPKVAQMPGAARLGQRAVTPEKVELRDGGSAPTPRATLDHLRERRTDVRGDVTDLRGASRWHAPVTVEIEANCESAGRLRPAKRSRRRGLQRLD